MTLFDDFDNCHLECSVLQYCHLEDVQNVPISVAPCVCVLFETNQNIEAVLKSNVVIVVGKKMCSFSAVAENGVLLGS